MKIFCLGFNKTGSSSLHAFFEANSLRSKHNIRWPHYSHISAGKFFFHLHDAYCDGERANFVRLKKWFPKANFIFNDREEHDWIKSRIHHFLNHQCDQEENLKDFFDKQKYGVHVPEMIVCPHESIDYWVANYRAYKKLVTAYFNNDPHFLVVRVTEDSDWQSQLIQFLSNSGKKFKKTDPRTRFNSSPKANTNHPDVEKYMSYYKEKWC